MRVDTLKGSGSNLLQQLGMARTFAVCLLLFSTLLVDRCSSQSRCSVDGSLRLVGGNSQYEGRVEVCRGRQWGTVCDDHWDSTDSSVVCRQLRYSPTGSQAFSTARFGAGSGPIHMDDVQCSGTESRLLNCRYTSRHNCGHSEDASVRCQPPPSSCSNGDIRLRGSSVNNSGRVEVCKNNMWGTVCDDGWSSVDAKVVCRQLGFSTLNAVAYQRAHFGAGTGLIAMDDVACSGSESRLVNCRHTTRHNCGHSEDAGVLCKRIVCSSGDVRLTTRGSNSTGRVEICLNNVWGTVCDDYWGRQDTEVVCAQLGFSRFGGSWSSSRSFALVSLGIHMDDVSCRGSETRLIDCSYDSNTRDCGHYEDVYVTCQVSNCMEGAVRLANGNSTAGRVEVCYQGSWGTVCDDRWGNIDAGVVCRQLGFSRYNAVGIGNARFGQGSVPIKMDEVRCLGTESSLVNCNFASRHDCQHSEDAGVICNQTLRCIDGDLQLRGGRNGLTSEGRVEVCWNESWGTVCDSNWDSRDAQVVCHQLGYPRTGSLAYSNAFFGRGTGSILLDRLSCTGNELKLINCSHSGVGRSSIFCGHNDDAGVKCTNAAACRNESAVRLVNGTNSTSGRVEICREGAWGTVCDDFWDSTDAGVVCRQLGFSRYNAIARGNARFGQGVGSIHLDDVRCSGTESRLLDCTHNSMHNCRHYEDAGVVCNATLSCMNGAVRLRGSRLKYQGRVEVCWNETWGTVCDFFWSSSDAKVVCKQLGFSGQGARAYHNAFFGQGLQMPIYLQGLSCRGSEPRLVDCTHSGVGVVSSFCGHDDDASVICPNVLLCEEGALRLVGGVSPYEGRVEVCGGDGEWGTVCDDGWSLANTRVVCRQLNFTSSAITPQSFGSARYGVGTGNILQDDVTCTGSEISLMDCPHVNSTNHNCRHSEDVGVRCSQCNENTIRLRGGSTIFEGRVEVCLGGVWGSICLRGWSPYDAIVTCRQLGFSTLGARYVSLSRFGQGPALAAMDNVRCTSREALLTSCPYLNSTRTTSPCSLRRTAGVICNPPPVRSPQSVVLRWVTSTSIALRWTVRNQAHVTVTGFQVNCSSLSFSSVSSFGSITVEQNTTFSAVVRGLEEYTTHRCCVTVQTGRGDTASTCRTVTTTQAAPSGPPTNFRGHADSPYSLNLLWSLPLTADRNGLITSYTVRVQKPSGVYLFTSSRTTFKRVASLKPYQDYNCTVAASTSAGRGPYTSTVVLRTSPDVPSAPPSSVTVISTTPTSFTLSISPPEPEAWNGIITIYTTNVSTTTTDTYSQTYSSRIGKLLTISSLTPYTTYKYIVSASTSAGSGPTTGEAVVTTNETAPSRPPENVQVNVRGPRSISVRWNRVPRQYENGRVRYYIIRVNSTVGTISISRSPATIYTLNPFTYYAVEVAAYTVELGPFSSLIAVRTAPDAPSKPPEDVVVLLVTPTTLSMTWSPPPISSRNGVISHYLVRVTSSTSGSRTITTANTYLQTLVRLNANYSVQVAAINSAGNGLYSQARFIKTPILAPSAAPANLNVTAIHSRALIISWVALADEEWNGDQVGLRIEVLELESGNRRIFTVSNVAATTLVVNSLYPCYTYRCRVVAYNSVGSGPSANTSVTMPEDVPSTAPTQLEGVALSPRALNLSWIAPDPRETTCIITGYAILISLEGVSSILNFSSNTLMMPYQVFDLKPYKRYMVQVAAETAEGRGPYSEEISIYTPEDAPSDHPVNFTVVELASANFTLSWAPPPPEYHHGIIREYRVNVTETGSGHVLQFSTSSTQLVVTDLRPYHEYECVVVAVTVDQGPNSSAIVVRTREAAPSGPPRDITAQVWARQITLHWNLPEPQLQNGLIRNYFIVVEQRSTNMITEHQTFGNSATIVIRNLNPYTLYHVRIAAHTIARGPYSANIEIQTNTAIPGRPRNFLLTSSSPTALTATWREPEDLNGVLQNFIIKIRSNYTGAVREWHISSLSRAYTWRDLHPYYIYEVSLSAQTSAGRGPAVSEMIQMPEASPSSFPLNITVSHTSPRSVVISWGAPRPEDHNGLIVFYQLFLMELYGGRNWTERVTAMQYQFNFLEEYYQYSVTVAAETIALGPHSHPLHFTTLPDSPSVAPLNLVLRPSDGTALSVSWEPLSYEHTNGPDFQYSVNVSHMETSANYYTTTSTTSVDFTSLHPDYVYECSVAAVNRVGQGPHVTGTVRMLEAPPSSPPSRVVVLLLSATTLSVSWGPPPIASRNGAITLYTVWLSAVGEASISVTNTTNPHVSFSALRPNLQYSVRVAAHTRAGMGPYSSLHRITTSIIAPSVAPSGLTIVEIESRSFSISWNEYSREHWNGEQGGFRIEVLEVYSGLVRSVHLVGGYSTYVEVFSLHPNFTYIFKIAAYNSRGMGNFSEISIQLSEDEPTGSPQSVLGDATSPRSFNLTWNLPDFEDRNGIITGYAVLILSSNESSLLRSAQEFLDLPAQGFTVLPYTTYFIQVAAETAVGRGPYSEVVTIYTPEDAPSDHPTNFVSSALTSTSFTLSWAPPPPEYHHGIIREYRVNVTETGSGRVLQFSTSSTQLVVTDLRPYHEYECVVVAVTVGQGPNSSAILVRTRETVPSESPLNIVAEIYATRISVRWDPPRNDSWNGIIRKYQVWVTENVTGDDIFIISRSSRVTIARLKPFTNYSIRVSAFTVGFGPYSPTIQLQTLQDEPGPLRNVTLKALNSTTLEVTWEDPEFVNGILEGFVVRLTSSEDTSLVSVARVPSTVHMYMWGSLHPYYTYMVSIVAVTAAGSGPAVSGMFQLPEDAPTSSPLNVMVTNRSPTSVTISWNAPHEEDHNGVITMYHLFLEAEGSSRTLATSAMSYSLYSLEEYFSYNVSVAARTVALGPFSIPHQFRTLADTPSVAPLNLVLQPSDGTTLSVSWEPLSYEDTNGPDFQYSVNVSHVETSANYYTTTSTTSVDFASLHPDYVYECSVAAVNKVGQGPRVTGTVRMLEAPPSGPPSHVVVSLLSATTLSVSWGPPSIASRNGAITLYTVWLSTVGGASISVTNTTNSHVSFSALRPNLQYSVRVTAHTRAGMGPYSSLHRITTSILAPTAIPYGLTLSTPTPESMTITWNTYREEDWSGDQGGFKIEITEQESGQVLNYTVLGSSSTSKALHSLHPHYHYQCRLAAYNSAGIGPYATNVTQMPQKEPNSPPQDFLGNATSARSIGLSWRPLDFEDRNGIITGYAILILSSNESSLLHSAQEFLDLPAQGFTVLPYATYFIQVAAETAVGRGPYSEVVTIYTPEDAPSDHPTNFVSSALTSTSFTLSWAPPPPEYHHGIIREYRVNVTETGSGRVLQFSTSSTQLVVTDLRPYHEYECVVVAVTVGQGPNSSAILVRTRETAPQTPPVNIVISSGATEISVQWDAPRFQDRNGIIRKYNVKVNEIRTARVIQSSSTSEMVVVSNLRPFTNYTVQVAAYTVSWGPYSDAVIVRTDPDLPGYPTNLTLIALNSTLLSAAWKDPEVENGLLEGFQLTLSAHHLSTSVTVSARVHQYLWGNLHPHTTYEVSVASFTSAGTGASVVKRIVMPEEAPSSEPENVRIVWLSSTAATVSWEPPAPEDQNGMIDVYHLVLVDKKLGDRNWTASTARQSYTFRKLAEHHTYTVKVAAETVSIGPYSLPLTFTTEEDVPGAPPVNLELLVFNATALSVTWHPPAFEDRNGVIIHYALNVTLLSKAVTHRYLTASTFKLLTSLHPYYSYECSVAAVTSVGHGPYATQSIRMPETSPVRPPRKFNVSIANGTALRLTWEPPELEFQNGMIRSYIITISTLEAQQTDSHSVGESARSLLIANLHPFYTYNCSISASTVSGGPQSYAVVQLPEAIPAAGPSELVAEYRQSRPYSVHLSWEQVPVDLRNGIIIGYVLTVNGSLWVNRTALSPEVLSYEITGLLLNVVYDFSLAAETSAGVGPDATVRVSTSFSGPKIAPSVGTVERVSPEEIQVSWSYNEEGVRLTGFVVKYRHVISIHKRNLEDLTVSIETNQSSCIITGLDPRLAYAVSVAAKNRAGPGVFSEEVIANLYSNIKFSIRMEGAIVCIPWLSHDGGAKELSILSTVAGQLSAECSCLLSVRYIANPSLTCGEGTTDRVVLSGAIVALKKENSKVKLGQLLQAWVDSTPVIEVTGVSLQVTKCPINATSRAGCHVKEEVTEPSVLSTTLVVKVATLKSLITESVPIVMYGGIGAGVFLVFGVAVACCLAVWIWNVQRKKRRKVRIAGRNKRSTDNRFNGGVSNPIAESSLNETRFEFGDSGSHIYDDPELLMSNINAKASTSGYLNQAFGTNRMFFEQRLSEDLSQLEKKHEGSRGMEENDCHKGSSGDNHSSSSSLSPLQAAPGYDVPRRIMLPNEHELDKYTPLTGRVSIVENDYQDINTSRSERSTTPLEAAARNGHLPPLTIYSNQDEVESGTKEEEYMEMKSPSFL